MTDVRIVDVPATRPEIGQMAAIIGQAFSDLAVSRFLIPDAAQRASILTRHLGQQLEWARTHGQLLSDSGRTSVAVWFAVPAHGLPVFADYELRRAQICGEHTDRFAEFERRMEERHPRGRDHWYLALMAVHPSLQGRGLGAAHLGHQTAFLDLLGRPAYLEAADLRSRQLYLRYGFVDHGEPFACGQGGPSLYPMWREPTSGA